MSKVATHCRCCWSRNLDSYLYLGDHPLANDYRPANMSTAASTYPLEVVLCRECFHSQLSIVVSPEEMFENYLYVSGTTTTLRSHFTELSVSALRRIQSANLLSPTVLDIGCNDGTLLEEFRFSGAGLVVGVDPAKNLRPLTEAKNIPVITDYWNTKTAMKVMHDHGPVSIITGCNVFAHNDDLEGFLKACRIILTERGLVILEFPYAAHTILRNEFDQVYHEHLNYVLVNGLAKLATRVGFAIVGIAERPIHGGSLRVYLQSGPPYGHGPAVSKFIGAERDQGLLDPRTYTDFARQVKINMRELRMTIDNLREKGFRIIGYGASAKGNTMMNFSGVKLDYVVDDNPLKWGLVTPGMKVPIVSPDNLDVDEKNLAIVLTAWNFASEIQEKIRTRRSSATNDVLLTYVPTVSARELHDGNLEEEQA